MILTIFTNNIIIYCLTNIARWIMSFPLLVQKYLKNTTKKVWKNNEKKYNCEYQQNN